MNPFRKRRNEQKRRQQADRRARRGTPPDRIGSSSGPEPRRPRVAPRAASGSSRREARAGSGRRPRTAKGDATRFLAAARAAAIRGGEATASRARVLQPVLSRAGRRLLELLRPPAVLLLRLVAIVERNLRRALALLARIASVAVGGLSRVLTPERGVFAVIVAAAAALVVSQFGDYRGVEVGAPGYAGVETIAPPPQRFQETPGEVHAYVLIPIAVLAVVLAAVALRSRRWQLGWVVALIGLVAVAVVLLIDLPKGLDEGQAGVLFAGAEATLNDGFYAELAASGSLVFCGLLLSLNLRQAHSPQRRRRRASRRRSRVRKAPSLARSGT